MCVLPEESVLIEEDVEVVVVVGLQLNPNHTHPGGASLTLPRMLLHALPVLTVTGILRYFGDHALHSNSWGRQSVLVHLLAGPLSTLSMVESLLPADHLLFLAEMCALRSVLVLLS